MFCAISSQWNDRIKNLSAKRIESPDIDSGTVTFKHLSHGYSIHYTFRVGHK